MVVPGGALKPLAPAWLCLGVRSHPPFDLGLIDAEFMFEDAARPKCRGLLIFGNADTLGAHVLRLVDTGIPAQQNHVVNKAVGGENRQADIAVIAAGQSDQL